MIVVVTCRKVIKFVYFSRISKKDARSRHRNERLSSRKEREHGRGSRNISILPLRRSKREKRLTFSNFTPREMERTIFNRNTMELYESPEEVQDTLCLL